MALTKYVVSKDEAIYEAWPDVVLTDGGKLICVFMECKHHGDRTDARVTMRESLDRGRTWSEKKFLTEKGTREDFFNCARISKLNNGNLAIICDRVYGDENAAADNWIWFGDKEGTQWGEPIHLSFCKGIVPDKLKQLKSGRLLVAAHMKSQQTGKLEQYLWYSDDMGKTWSDRKVIGADPRYNLCEVSILERENGMLVAFMRENSGMGYTAFKSFSYDGGETWEGVYGTSLDGCHRPVSGYLADGTVMITYRFIPRGTQNMFAAFLKDEELEKTVRTEQTVRIFPLDFDRNPAPDLGYTGWVQFEDGEIYVVNYIKDDSDQAQIRGYSFYKEDVILPEKATANRSMFGE